jgi:hypothetical protein
VTTYIHLTNTMQKQPLKWVLDIQHKCILASSIFNEGPNSFLKS